VVSIAALALSAKCVGNLSLLLLHAGRTQFGPFLDRKIVSRDCASPLPWRPIIRRNGGVFGRSVRFRGWQVCQVPSERTDVLRPRAVSTASVASQCRSPSPRNRRTINTSPGKSAEHHEEFSTAFVFSRRCSLPSWKCRGPGESRRAKHGGCTLC
jgi:hypothetical protein